MRKRMPVCTNPDVRTVVGAKHPDAGLAQRADAGQGPAVLDCGAPVTGQPDSEHAVADAVDRPALHVGGEGLAGEAEALERGSSGDAAETADRVLR